MKPNSYQVGMRFRTYLNLLNEGVFLVGSSEISAKCICIPLKIASLKKIGFQLAFAAVDGVDGRQAVLSVASPEHTLC
jgi:hypothetical protein